MTLPLIVIAQIKNEERSLPRFLSTCEMFADKIILLDQGSVDRSTEIAGQFRKVRLFQNPDKHLNENSTIAQMYEFARSEVPGHKIILRLDADEVLTANAQATAEWNTLRSASPGTVICLPRIEILSFGECYVYSILDRGYVDDGRTFQVRQIHANSTPIKLGLPTLNLNRIHILHYSGLREKFGEAKMRYYCMLDNIYGTRPVFERRILYRQGHILDMIRSAGRRVEFDESWIKDYEFEGIDMTSVLDDQSTWHDAACVDLMIEQGSKRFFMDPIWYYDWERVIYSLPAGKQDTARAAFERPPYYLRKLGGALDRIYRHNRLPFKNKSKAFLNSQFAYGAT